MKNQITNKISVLAVLSATSLTFLSACSGGSGAPSTITDGVASISVSGTYSNNGTIFTSDDRYNYNAVATEARFNLRPSGNNLIMTINGVDYTLNFNGSQWKDSNNPSSRLYLVDHGRVSSTSILDTLTGSHQSRHGTHVFYGADGNNYTSGATDFSINYTEGYAAVGIKTPDSAVETQTATATYTGTVNIDAGQANVQNSPQIQGLKYSGTLSMQVDFDANMVEGTVTFDTSSRTLSLAPAPIVGNGFAGTFTASQATRDYVGLTDNPTGQYAGSFFGPNAEDLAGVMRFNGRSARGAVIGYGGFRADRR